MSEKVQARWALIEFRKTRRLTQRDLANLLQTNHANISLIEAGTHDPTSKMLGRFAEVFQLDAEACFALSEQEPTSRKVCPTAATRRAVARSYPTGILRPVAESHEPEKVPA
jgi:transcriptional regulator with XRE-family HTH domain